MNIVLSDMGERLQLLRKGLEISQKELAQTLQVGQNQISRLENGLGGSIDLLLLLINFYNDHFLISYLFNENFEVVRKDEARAKANPFNSIALERLKLLQSEFNEKMLNVISVMEKA